MKYADQKKKSLGNQDILSLREKAAIFMVSLGEETAGEIMKYLADIEIDTSNMKPSNVSELLFDSLKSHLGVENE